MANTFTTELLRTAITGRFAYVNFDEDNTTAIRVPRPGTSVRWIRAASGNDLTFAIDFRWRQQDQPYPDYVINTLIEFTPTGDFRFLKADGHGDLSEWVCGWWGNAGAFIDELRNAPYIRPELFRLNHFIDELATMCICDFLEAHKETYADD